MLGQFYVYQIVFLKHILFMTRFELLVEYIIPGNMEYYCLLLLNQLR